MNKLDLLQIPELASETAEVRGTTIQKVTVRELTLAERLELEDKKEEGVGSWSSLLVVASVVDEGGERLFNWDDAKLIDGLPSLRFADVIRVARKLSYIGAAAEAEAVKNSEATPTVASK